MNRTPIPALVLAVAVAVCLPPAAHAESTPVKEVEAGHSGQAASAGTAPLTEQSAADEPADRGMERPDNSEFAEPVGRGSSTDTALDSDDNEADSAATAGNRPAQSSPSGAAKSLGGTGMASGHAVPVNGSSSILSVMAALLGVVLMILATAWMIKRFTGLSPLNNRQIKMVAALPIGARERVVLIEVGGQQLLLGVTPQQINTLHAFKEPLAALPDKPGNMEFAQRLQAILKKGGTE